MSSNDVLLITKKNALSKLGKIVRDDDHCYYLSDDYASYLRLQQYYSGKVEIRNLSGKFHGALTEIHQSFLDMFADLNKQHDSLTWWGTHLASRNSASTPLLRNIIYLYCARDILDESNGSNRRVVFIAESPALMDSISKLASERRLRVGYSARIRMKIAQYGRLGLVYLKRTMDFFWRNSQSRRAAFRELNPLTVKKPEKTGRVVIRTWITKGTFRDNGEFNDRNFGVLPAWLRSQGYEVWTLPMFFNLPGSAKEIYHLMATQGDPYLIPHHYLKLIDYFQMYWMGFKQLRIPLRNVMLESMDVTSLFREVQLLQGFNPELLTLNLCYPLLGRLSKAGFEIDGFYYPFENNVPEKPFVLGNHNYFPLAKIVAYQHTVWYSEQLGMFLSAGEVTTHPIADRIVCSGSAYLRILGEAGFPVEVLKPGPNLRFVSVSDNRTNEHQDTAGQKIVLIPLPYEKHLAYELIYKVKVALDNSSEYITYIRTHPLLPKVELYEFLGEIGMTNVEFADVGTMKDWLSKTYTVISPGASVTILESAVRGIPVIRVIPDNTFFFDPFAWADYPVPPVSTAEGITDSLSLIAEILERDRNAFRNTGEQVLSDYFTPVDEESLKAFL
ncbi:MAG: hypothetical protein HQ553_07990 [Chloroflexi bacterium]|nr:hypothetical protein [Chloroflexota bacterium]